MRYVVLDTETTGLNHQDGDRVFEIGCVEIVDKRSTGRTFHCYTDPQRNIPAKSLEICRIDPAILVGKPIFADIVEGLMNFLNFDESGEKKKAVIIAHNARFDMDFLNAELARCNAGDLSDFEFFDTVKMAKVRYPKNSASLDNLCKMLSIDLSEREKYGHGALIDSKLLSLVFLSFIKDEPDDYIYTFNKAIESFFGFTKQDKLLVAREYLLTAEEIEVHEAFLKSMGCENLW